MEMFIKSRWIKSYEFYSVIGVAVYDPEQIGYIKDVLGISRDLRSNLSLKQIIYAVADTNLKVYFPNSSSGPDYAVIGEEIARYVPRGLDSYPQMDYEVVTMTSPEFLFSVQADILHDITKNFSEIPVDVVDFLTFTHLATQEHIHSIAPCRDFEAKYFGEEAVLELGMAYERFEKARKDKIDRSSAKYIAERAQKIEEELNDPDSTMSSSFEFLENVAKEHAENESN